MNRYPIFNIDPGDENDDNGKAGDEDNTDDATA